MLTVISGFGCLLVIFEFINFKSEILVKMSVAISLRDENFDSHSGLNNHKFLPF